jgi:putative FmdB family regulatory protein
MPIYEYQCEECGVRFERMQSMSAPSVAVCPECGGHVHRVISSVGVIFKGSGFYVTDNRRSGASTDRGRAKSEPDGGSDAADKTETKESTSDKAD